MRSRELISAACLAAMLAGCGGSSNTMPDTEMMPDTDMTPDTGSTGPIGLTAGVDRLFASGRTERIADDGMTTITETSDGWNMTVDGKTIEFSSSDLGAHPLIGNNYWKEFGTNEAVVFAAEDPGGFGGDPEFDYLNVYLFSHNEAVPGADLSTFEVEEFTRGNFIYVVHGTPTNDMPMSGTATYGGRVHAREWRSDAAVFGRDSTMHNGAFDMTATFGASGAELTGTFSFREVPGGTIPFTLSTTSGQLSIGNLSIDEGPFAGYQDIGVRAAFFGPEAAEVGGVFEGADPAASKLMHGYFAGEKQ